MGTERYMAMIRSASYGIDRFAQTTDPAEGEESENEAVDMEIDPTPPTPTVRRSIQLLVNNLRDRQNEMLENEEFRHAAMFQHVVIQALDVLGGSAPVDMEALMRLKTLAHDVLMMISRHVRTEGQTVLANRYQRYAVECTHLNINEWNGRETLIYSSPSQGGVRKISVSAHTWPHARMTRANHDEKCGHETALTIREALLLKQEKDASVPSFVLQVPKWDFIFSVSSKCLGLRGDSVWRVPKGHEGLLFCSG